MSDDRRSRGGDYRAVRIGATAGLTAAMIVMLLVDTISVEYEVSPPILVILSALIAGLVAIDLPDWLDRGAGR